MILMLASIGAYIGVVWFWMSLSCLWRELSGSPASVGYSIPGIVLGLILGKIGEQNFAQGMQMVHYDLVTYFHDRFAQS